MSRCTKCAVDLIKKGLAYVCELTPEQMREYRGDLTAARPVSPYRDRPVEESLDLFRRMRDGEFPDGEHDPAGQDRPGLRQLQHARSRAIYRINHMHHHRTGDKWCIYPMYDFAHPIEDALEGITHSLCSLEFEDHRPLYNWVVEHCRPARQAPADRVCPPGHQLHRHEQAQAPPAGGGRHVSPAGMTPGCPPCAACAAGAIPPVPSGTSATASAWPRSASTVEYGFLEHCLREDLNETAPRVMAVLHPVKLTITNYPEGKTRDL